MQILARIFAVDPDLVAHRWVGGECTYGELVDGARRLSVHIDRLPPGPVGVFGAKDPLMLMCFLGTVTAGRSYVPIDASTPPARVLDIARQAKMPTILAVSDLELDWPTVTRVELDSWLTEPPTTLPVPVAGAPFYTIFTSGSTGKPKGVQITNANLESFVDWCRALVSPSRQVFLNQAPWSFDLSVMDTYCALSSGDAIFSLEKSQFVNGRALRDALAESEVTVWVSTPSFADLALASARIDGALLPNLHTFLFCGETLTPATVRALRTAFPSARIFNTYGPTEATVAVTAVEITDEVLCAHPVLPVGYVKPGVEISIRDESGCVVCEGETGEIFIHGDSVSPGYLGRPDLNQISFAPVDDRPTYRTGDSGRLIGGLLFFEGRLDFQVKLHGYRMELGDIEANFAALPQVAQVAVLPVSVAGAVSHLEAHVVLAPGSPEPGLALTVALKRVLKERLPEYMVPKNIRYHETLPLTVNGKVDRRALAER